MSKKELLRGIKEDEILATLTENLKFARENAQSLREKAERRECQLLAKFNNYGTVSEPINTYDIEEIEKAVERTETRDEIARKILVMKKVKGRCWTRENRYREAMAQYFTYITPILTDLETAKHESRMKIAEINVRYKNELAEARKEFNTYEGKVKELFTVASEIGPYMHQVSYVESFGGIARSDDFADAKAKHYGQPNVIENERTSFNQWGGHTQY